MDLDTRLREFQAAVKAPGLLQMDMEGILKLGKEVSAHCG